VKVATDWGPLADLFYWDKLIGLPVGLGYTCIKICKSIQCLALVAFIQSYGSIYVELDILLFLAAARRGEGIQIQAAEASRAQCGSR